MSKREPESGDANKRSGDLMAPFQALLGTPEGYLDELFPITNDNGDLVGVISMHAENEDRCGVDLLKRFSLASDDDTVVSIKLSHIEVFEAHRGNGHARKALEAICSCADKHRTVLTLVADAQSENVVQKKLEDFYKGLGFVMKTNVMQRDPEPPEDID